MYMYVVQPKESGTKEGKKKQTQCKKTAKSESPDQVIVTKSQMLQLISIYFFCLILSKKCTCVICLPTEHQGVQKNSFRNVCAFQDRIGIWKCWFAKDREKAEYTEKNLLEQSREPTTNSTHIHV